MRFTFLTLAFLAGTYVSQVPAAAMPIEWTVAPARTDAEVQLTIAVRERGNNSTTTSTLSRAELEGLDAGTGDRRRFAVRRPAGTLDCSGLYDGRRGTGTCAFAADPAFAKGLAARGIAAPTERQSLQLALHRADLKLLETLARYDYARPTIDQLIAAGIFSVTPAYVQSLADAGYRVGSLDKLVTLRIHDVKLDWIRALGRASPSLMRVSADQLIAMRIHGVSPGDVEAYAKLGYRDLTPQQLIAMSIHGVSPEFAQRAQRSGARPDPDRLVAMRIHGTYLN
ncbi:MAG: hypothetical protein V4530_00260 [Pseudomonadota bacterium]